ncbi:MAG: DNA-binding transcriptional regulator [Planctomycetia bacterium]|nr:DNA-binding transcriptional regulator [Planctomycetia bacterium]
MKSVVVTLSLNKHFDRKVVAGIRRYLLQAKGWSIYLEDDPQSRPPDFKDRSIDGIIAELDDPVIPRFIAGLDVAIVGIGGIKREHVKDFPISTVETDNCRIAELAARHLLDCRLTHFAYCGMRLPTIDPWIEQREAAFVEFLRARGRRCSVFRERPSHTRSWARLRAALVSWIESLPRPVGVFACNDARGRHVLEACRLARVQVPDELAVIGVNNDELFCHLTQPPLTSVIQGAEEIGYQAAQLLDLLMRGRLRKRRHLAIPPVGIAMRGSTDVVASDDAIVSGAMRLIREQATAGVSVEDVARHLNVSRSTLELHFKKGVGRSVHDEIQRVQLNAVKDLLATTDLGLEQIAARTGHSSAQYLTTVFRRELSRTPGQYRRAAR